MSYILRTLSIRDVARALQHRELGLGAAHFAEPLQQRGEHGPLPPETVPPFDPPGHAEGVMIRALTFTAGLGLQGVGLYAAVVTFGAWVTVGLYAVGGLAVVLQHVVLRRTTCSPGE